MALSPNGKIVIVGSFTTVNGVTRNGVAQLNRDGSLDTIFDPGAGPNDITIVAVALQSNAKAILGGYFTAFNGVPRPGVVRLLAGPTNGPPGIAVEPQNQTVVVSNKVALSVGAYGLEPLHYQWQHGSVNLLSETNNVLTISTALPGDAGEYRVLVTNTLGAITSQVAALTLTPSRIITQPQDRTVRAGSNVSFSVSATGPGPLEYQWRLNDRVLDGESQSNLTINGVQLNNEGVYTVRISNSFGSITSDQAGLNVLIAPSVRQAPISQSVVEGGSLTLSISVSGHPAPFRFYWRRSATNVADFVFNEPTCFFTFNNMQTNESGLYGVIVTNAAGGLFVPYTVTVLADSDKDGVPDVWEAEHGFNPTNSADGQLDSDGDGLANWQEYLAGTDPADAVSSLRIDRISLNGSAMIRFEAISNRTYTVEFTDAVESGQWLRLADVVARASNRTERIIDPSFPPRRYYRLATPRTP
jgi:hypothetical protein